MTDTETMSEALASSESLERLRKTITLDSETRAKIIEAVIATTISDTASSLSTDRPADHARLLTLAGVEAALSAKATLADCIKRREKERLNER